MYDKIGFRGAAGNQRSGDVASHLAEVEGCIHFDSWQLSPSNRRSIGASALFEAACEAMKLFLRKAAVRWEGGPKGGNRVLMYERDGVKAARSGAPVQGMESSTDPAELIAAAHASSFSLALVEQLQLTRSAAGEIYTSATVTLEHLEAGWTIVGIHLAVTARLPKVTQGQFIDATVRAKTSCIVSRALPVTVSMSAKLEEPKS